MKTYLIRTFLLVCLSVACWGVLTAAPAPLARSMKPVETRPDWVLGQWDLHWGSGSSLVYRMELRSTGEYYCYMRGIKDPTSYWIGEWHCDRNRLHVREWSGTSDSPMPMTFSVRLDGQGSTAEDTECAYKGLWTKMDRPTAPTRATD